jgi:hypothetical protein
MKWLGYLLHIYDVVWDLDGNLIDQVLEHGIVDYHRQWVFKMWQKTKYCTVRNWGARTFDEGLFCGESSLWCKDVLSKV